MEQKTSIKEKLNIITLWITGAAFASAFITLVIFNKAMIQKELAWNLTILSKVMATNVDSSLVFLDKVSAHEILSSLSSNPSIVMGCLYDKEGNAFAAYLLKAVDNLSCSPNMDKSNSVTGTSYISHIQPVVLDSETVGFLEILIELKLFDFQVQKFALVTFIIFLCTLLIVFLLSKRLNKIIIFPIFSLLNLIKKVSNRKNYSLRAEKFDNDEIGDLIDEFNIMLSQIEKHEKDLEFQIKERTQAEEESSKAKEKLQIYSAELERSNDALRDFASIASHDLQEPIRTISMFGDRLNDYAEVLDERGQDYLKRMIGASERMNILILDFLEFTRVTSAGMKFETVDLNQIISEVFSDLEILIDQTEGKVEMKGALPILPADKLQMRQLFQNLIGNSLKFHKEGEPPLIQISSLLTPKGNWEIKLRDNGIGFDIKYLNRILKPFQRLHTREKFKGSGMGLAICQKIILRHGGTLTAISSHEQGSTFIIVLPNKQPAKEESESLY